PPKRPTVRSPGITQGDLVKREDPRSPRRGRVLCAVHPIRREVSAENMDAMYEEAFASGSCPINGSVCRVR
ncbi:MAG: hypothetical protein ACC628_16545, partial [Pirellulaceae bacterium]